MKTLLLFVTAFVLAGCAICKPTDSVEICRTKQRNHQQGNGFIAAADDRRD